MSQVKDGDTIKVHYTGKFEDGVVFDTSSGRDPLKFVVGQGNVVQGFEAAVLGMDIGDKKTVELPPDQGYGDRNDKLVADI